MVVSNLSQTWNKLGSNLDQTWIKHLFINPVSAIYLSRVHETLQRLNFSKSIQND
jgi:hypothetical protein